MRSAAWKYWTASICVMPASSIVSIESIRYSRWPRRRRSAWARYSSRAPRHTRYPTPGCPYRPPALLRLPNPLASPAGLPAGLSVAAQPRAPGVRRVLKHLVCGPRLSSVEAEIDVRFQHAGGNSVRHDRPIVTGESPELLILDVADRADDRDRGEVDVFRGDG